METVAIKNVVFDVGNVIVRWSPIEIVRLTFGNDIDAEKQAKKLFQSENWLNLNKGLLTEEQSKQQYQSDYGLTANECDQLFYYVKHSQLLIFGTIQLMKRLKTSGYRVYALTDNVREIVEHLKTTYDFWPLFDGATVSADLCLLKPQPEIYQALLSQHSLQASETVFLDDMPHNVTGAQQQGIHAIQFINAQQCEQDLKQLGLNF